jgi:sec-independent protein translocase protein TatA
MNLSILSGQILFLDISGGELLLIIIVIFVVFGPNKIPEIARTLGKGFNEIRNASNQIKSEINREVNHIKNEVKVDVDIDDEPAKGKQAGESPEKK